ncbi:hypothetical protein V2E25_02975 [Mycoplasmopsis arginini]|uniref:Lipoprotein n=1 Tax=Mycoplasmopsis arginini TaxID=2094 RepID=A0ABZ2AII7_MYCAR|nr:hypothetical protein [Mycoplasmopsis arginini]WVN21919.1 hypothetical protein V2E25_02975 [Mycoplasmopsis arginini]VEU81933.1 Uncharacterised protein [Mycoplasmopsis arginini]
MKKNKLLFLGTVGSFALPIISISCQNEKTLKIDDSKINTKYLSKLNLQQLATLHNFEPIFLNPENNKEQRYLGKITDITADNELVFESSLKYKTDLKLQPSWKQVETKYDNYKIEKNKQSNNNVLNDLFKEYDFENIKSAGGYSNQWFYFLAQNNKTTDYYRVLDPYFFDFQTIIFRLVHDIKTNNGLMNVNSLLNKNGLAYITRNIFNNNFIQANSWLNNESKKFRESFLNFLVLYLNKFDLKIKDIIVDWSKSKTQDNDFSNQSFISFKIKDIISFDNKSIVNDEIKEKTFYINGFRNYATEDKFGVGESGLDEKLPLFNDYVQNPYLKIKKDKNLDIGFDINSFIKGYNSIDYWNSRGLVYLFSKFKNRLELEVPHFYKEVDEKYQVIDVQFTDYYQTSQIIKLIIRVHNKNGKTKDYVLLSSNFDDHGHFLKALAIQLKPVESLESVDYAIYRKDSPLNFAKITLNDFSNTNLFSSLIQKAIDKTKTYIKSNEISEEYKAALLDIFSAHLNNYLLAYALETQESNLNSGIKKIELNSYVPNGNSAEFNFGFYKFISPNDFNFINDEEKPYFELKINIDNLFSNKESSFQILSKGVKNE